MKKRLSLVVALAMLLQVLMLVPVMAEDTAPALTELKYDSTSKSVSCKVSNLEASEIKGAYLVRFNNAGEWIENIYGSPMEVMRDLVKACELLDLGISSNKYDDINEMAVHMIGSYENH